MSRLVLEAPLRPGGPPARVVVDGPRVASVGPAEGRADLAGDLLTTGLVDAHAHPVGLGERAEVVDLAGARSLGEVVARLRAAARALPAGAWLLGAGWDHEAWTDLGRLPRADDLPDLGRPVRLRRRDGHALWLDRRALRAAGIGPATPDPEGGRILRDPDGRPTGVLLERAMRLVPAPRPDAAALRRRLLAGLRALRAAGLAGVHDLDADDALFDAWLAVADDLPFPVAVFVHSESEAARELLRRGPWTRGRLRVAGVKAYADGALGSRGAALLDDYADAPGERGVLRLRAAGIAALARAGSAAGAVLAVHAIGDAAASEVVAGFERAGGGGRLRLEHAQLLPDGAVARLAAAGVRVSVQPAHAVGDGPWLPRRLGPERAARCFPLGALARAGVPLLLGSDAPVDEHRPAAVAAAARRAVPDPLDGPSVAAAYTAGWADLPGPHPAPRPGAPADLCLWRRAADGALLPAVRVRGGEAMAVAGGPTAPPPPGRDA